MSTQQLRPPPLQNPSLCRKQRAPLYATSSPSSLKQYSTRNGIKAITLDELPPNALRRKRDPHWRGGFSLGLHLRMARTGVALGKSFSIRPLTRGQKLEVQLLKIAELEMVLERYFCMAGQDVELVLPKKLDLHEKLQRGPPKDIDFFSQMNLMAED